MTKKKTLLEFSSSVADHRVKRNKIYSSESILFMTLCGAICGCQTWKEITLFAASKKQFFKQEIPSYSGIPSHDTFERFFSMLDIKEFELNFRAYVQELIGDYKGLIAIDGKTIRSTTDKGGTRTTLKERLHMVSAFAVDQGICLCQEKVNKKENEIVVIPKLLKALDIEGCVVTIDAMGTQRKIAKQITEQKGDYIFIVKGNHKKQLNDLKEFMNSYSSEKLQNRTDEYTVSQKVKGAIVQRSAYVGNNVWNFGKEFPFEGMKSFGWIHITKKEEGKNDLSEIKFFISSLEMDAKKIVELQRKHWAIENNLHWQLDVSFNEDQTRKTGNSAVNYSLINKIALAAIIKTEEKYAVASKRKLAGWDDEFLRKIINLI